MEFEKKIEQLDKSQLENIILAMYCKTKGVPKHVVTYEVQKHWEQSLGIINRTTSRQELQEAVDEMKKEIKNDR